MGTQETLVTDRLGLMALATKVNVWLSRFASRPAELFEIDSRRRLLDQFEARCHFHQSNQLVF
jgi:hypothetical protein